MTDLYPEPLHELPAEGAVLPDHNAEIPDADFEYQSYPVVDLNNLPDQWALDLNGQLPEAPPEPPEPPEVPEGDPTADWIGDRLSGDVTNLPKSVYLSPDLTFKDPPDHEEPYGDVTGAGFGDYRP